MSKLKDKIIGRLLSDKNKQINKNDNNYQNDFTKIIPPTNSSSQEPIQEDRNYHQIHDLKNVNVTTSFALHEKQNYVAQQPKTMIQSVNDNLSQENLVALSNNFKIPKAISFEIRISKLKNLFFIFLSLVVLIIATTFIGFWFGDKKLINYVPHPAITIPLAIGAITVFLVNITEYFALKKEVELYIERTLNGSLIPPNFIIRNYCKIHGRNIIFNWVFVTTYVLLGIVTLLMFLLSNQKITFFVQSWTVKVPNLQQDVITLLVILILMFFIHMLNFVIFKKRKTNIISYYGYEVVSPSDLEIYKKKINRICLIIFISFLVIIFFAIAIPILVVRRRKKKN